MTAVPAFRISLLSLLVTAIVSASSGDRQMATAATSVMSFAEFSGYDKWQLIAPAMVPNAGCGFSTDGCLKAITGNAAMISAMRNGIPANGQPVPDGAAMAKIEWARAPNPDSPYEVVVPGAYEGVSFMVKDAKRFPDTNGWGYAIFRFDAASGTFEPVTGPRAAAARCHACHLRVKKLDYVFTSYAPR